MISGKGSSRIFLLCSSQKMKFTTGQLEVGMLVFLFFLHNLGRKKIVSYAAKECEIS